uniref:Uncharacterized protein n=1 Tax=Romanomermis culicivorax TaxID=13658 RepID=A0A915HXY2_ROMCU
MLFQFHQSNRYYFLFFNLYSVSFRFLLKIFVVRLLNAKKLSREEFLRSTIYVVKILAPRMISFSIIIFEMCKKPLFPFFVFIHFLPPILSLSR